MKNSSKISKAETNEMEQTQSQTFSLDWQRTKTDLLFQKIVDLNKAWDSYEKDQLFDEASQVMEELRRLEISYKKSILEEIILRHQQEFSQLEEQYQQELGQMDNRWNQKLQESDQVFQNTYQNLESLHTEEQESLGEQLNNKYKGIRKNKTILNLEYQMSQLIKEKRYAEVNNIKKKIVQQYQELQEKQEKQFRIIRQNHFLNLNKKQEQIKQSLEQKFSSIQNEILKQREQDFESIHSKFGVFWDKLSTNHKQEIQFKKKELSSFSALSDSLLDLN